MQLFNKYRELLFPAKVRIFFLTGEICSAQAGTHLFLPCHELLTINYLRFMERISHLLAFLEKQPKDNFLRHALALEYIKLERLNEAKELFEAILTDSPDYIGSYYHLAKLLEQTGETATAIQWYERGMAAAKTAGDHHALNELRAAYEELVF